MSEAPPLPSMADAQRVLDLVRREYPGLDGTVLTALVAAAAGISVATDFWPRPVAEPAMQQVGAMIGCGIRYGFNRFDAARGGCAGSA